MKSSRWLIAALFLLQLAASEGFFLSFGLVGIGVAGLVGLKLFYGMKMLSPMLRTDDNGHNLAHGVIGPAPSLVGRHAMLSPIFRAIRGYGAPKDEMPTDEAMLSAEGGQQKAGVHQPAVPPGSSVPPMAPSGRIRRALPGGLKISGDVFRWPAKIDDEKCLHRYFCYLGAKPESFDDLGHITNMVVMLGGLPEDCWAAKMYRSGQQGGVDACPTECKDQQLQKTVAYLGKHIFDKSGDAKKAAPIVDVNQVSISTTRNED